MVNLSASVRKQKTLKRENKEDDGRNSFLMKGMPGHLGYEIKRKAK